MEFVAQAPDGTIRYADRKRYLWLVALTTPMLALFTAWLYFATGGNPWTTLVPLAFVFVWIPMLDGLIGEDTNNPPEAVTPAMGRDNYYRVLLYIHIAFLYAAFLVLAWLVGSQHLPWWAFLGLALGAGLNSADAIIIGHELGHKNNKADRVAAQVALALVGYGHFSIEHNRGHHVHVATPEDSASSRMGESVYKFALRDIPGALVRGWRLEKLRLAQSGRRAWSLHNTILQSWTLTVVVAIALVANYGWIMLPYLLIHHLYAWFGLTQANYVEHYGLLRAKLPSGRYELPQPKHSWNTNHIYSNLLTFHLQRHSDHHANALRPYQALRDFANVPRLPSGYPGCFGLASIPRVWFRIMDAKLLVWADGDLDRINVDPDRRAAIYARYGVTLPELRSGAPFIQASEAQRHDFADVDSDESLLDGAISRKRGAAHNTDSRSPRSSVQ